jgi:hypothetical protein
MSFDDLIGSEGLSPEDELRLRRVHDLLVQAGPPPDLSPELEHVPEPNDPPEVPLLFRRRKMAVAVLALAAALAAFAAGFAFGHSKGSSSFTAAHTVPMHGTHGELAVIKVGNKDPAGNWPMLVEVSGLPQQANEDAYYELWLTRDGRPVVPCGSFRVHGKTTQVRFTVPYALKGYDGWVVTRQSAHVHTPGQVVLTTT